MISSPGSVFCFVVASFVFVLLGFVFVIIFVFKSTEKGAADLQQTKIEKRMDVKDTHWTKQQYGHNLLINHITKTQKNFLLNIAEMEGATRKEKKKKTKSNRYSASAWHSFLPVATFFPKHCNAQTINYSGHLGQFFLLGVICHVIYHYFRCKVIFCPFNSWKWRSTVSLISLSISKFVLNCFIFDEKFAENHLSKWVIWRSTCTCSNRRNLKLVLNVLNTNHVSIRW